MSKKSLNMMRRSSGRRAQDRLTGLGRAAVLLNQAGGRGHLAQVLGLLAAGLGCREARLLQKRYEAPNRFVLHQAARWCRAWAAEGPAWRLTVEDLEQETWRRLKELEQVDPPPAGPRPGLRLAPLNLDGHLYGFLALVCDRAPRPGGLGQEFLDAFVAVLDLWISRGDLAKRLDDVLEAVPIPTLIEDTQGVITVWNPAMAERTGWGAPRVVGQGDYTHSVPFYDNRRPMVCDLLMYPDAAWEAVYPEFSRVGDTVTGMSYCPNLPGGPIYFRYKAVKLYDLNHRLRGVLEFIRDVTGEKVVEKELRRSETLYRTVTDFAGVGIVVFNAQRILHRNRFVSQLMGDGEGESHFQRLGELIHPEDRQRVLQCFEDLFRDPYQPAQFEFRGLQGKSIHHYRGFAGVLDFEDQATIHFIFDDITLKKDLAEKARLNELKLYHEDRLTSLGIMAAGIAHELNQPLSAIRVVAEGLLFGMEQDWQLDRAELGEGLEMISRQVRRMSQVIQNIRDFARDDQGVYSQEVDLNLAVDNVFSMIGRQLEARGVQVVRELDPHLPPVDANLHRLEQVIMNLVVNARQAHQESTRALKSLWVRTGRQGPERVFLEVGDNATGVPVEVMAKIFDPFFTTKQVGQGTGLGLSISKSIVTEFQGDISFCNNPQGGATFTVSLPVRV